MRRLLSALALLASCSRLAFAQPARPFDDSVRAALLRVLARVDTVHDTTIVTHVRVDTLLVTAPVVPPNAPPASPPSAGTFAADSAQLVARFRQVRPLRARIDSEPNWVLANYYGRDHIDYGYAWSFGDTAFWRSAIALTLDERDRFYAVNAYNIQPHQFQGAGLLEHYRLTGDTMSRHALVAFAGKYRTVWLNSHYMRVDSVSDPRIVARITESFLLAWLADTTPAQRAANGRALDTALVRVQARRHADGSFHSGVPGTVSTQTFCGGRPNYMNALLGTVLGRVFDDYRPDSLTFATVVGIGTYLWTEWRPADLSFNYVSFDDPAATCPTGGPTVSPDLNGLYLGLFGWLWRRTGNPVWRDRGDLILAGILRGKNVNNGTGATIAGSNGKMFNQAFSQLFGPRGYLALR